MPVFINQVLLEPSRVRSSVVCGYIYTPWQSPVVAAETVWSTKPKIVPIWPFTESLPAPGKSTACEGPG